MHEEAGEELRVRLKLVVLELADYLGVMCPFPATYLRTLALFNVERYSAELSTLTFVHRTAASFPPFDFIFFQ